MKKLVSIFFLIWFGQFVNASECYHYHTLTNSRLLIKNKQLYFQFTERDQNGFTYVKQDNKPLTGIDVASYKFYGEDEDVFIFADKAGVYSLRKNEQYEGQSAKFYKILNANEGIKNINGRLFFLDGKWIYIDIWQGKITKIVISELPANTVNIKCWSNGFYVKDDKNVYAIKVNLNEVKKYEVLVLPGLSSTEIKHYSCSPRLNEDYLADENTMFSIRTDGDFVDITPQLLALGFRNGYNAMYLLDENTPLWQTGNLMLKKRDGASSTRKSPLTGEDIEVEYAYSSAKLLTPLSGQSSYTIFRNKIYPIWDDNFSLPAQVAVNANQLIAVEGRLFRGKDFYYMGNTDNYKLTSINISADAKFYPTVSSYSKTLPNALVDEKFIYFIGERFDFKLGDQEALTNKVVKQLGSFYLFNHSLYDGTTTYSINADDKTLSYLGSFVEVVNGCAGSEPNSPQVEVVYHHFFKDKNSVYYFSDKTKNWQVIQTANESDYQADDYEDLQALYKIKDLKGSVKKKTNRPINYLLIIGSCLAFIAFGLLFYKKFKK